MDGNTHSRAKHDFAELGIARVSAWVPSARQGPHRLAHVDIKRAVLSGVPLLKRAFVVV